MGFSVNMFEWHVSTELRTHTHGCGVDRQSPLPNGQANSLCGNNYARSSIKLARKLVLHDTGSWR